MRCLKLGLKDVDKMVQDESNEGASTKLTETLKFGLKDMD